MSQVRGIPTQGFTYLEFITPGILTQSVTFVAIFYGLDIIMERDMGLLQKILVTPTPRLALVWGKMLSAFIDYMHDHRHASGEIPLANDSVRAV